jgi:hypothetical protein
VKEVDQDPEAGANESGRRPGFILFRLPPISHDANIRRSLRITNPRLGYVFGPSQGSPGIPGLFCFKFLLPPTSQSGTLCLALPSATKLRFEHSAMPGSAPGFSLTKDIVATNRRWCQQVATRRRIHIQACRRQPGAPPPGFCCQYFRLVQICRDSAVCHCRNSDAPLRPTLPQQPGSHRPRVFLGFS